MTSVRLDVTPFRIPFRRPFATARGAMAARAGLLIRLTDEHGAVGVGEVAPHPAAPPGELEAAWHELEALRREWDGRVGWKPGEGEEALGALASPCARAGLQTARLDLAARARGVSVAALLAPAPRACVPVNGTLDETDPSGAARRVQALDEEGFDCIKLKLASRDVAYEAGRLYAIRRAVGGRIRLRLDANAAWTVEEAIQAIERLAAYDLEYVEQPVADIAGLAAVRCAVGVRIAADESVTDVAAVRAIVAAGAADVVVIKPALCGPDAALAMMREAARHDLAAVVTSVFDTGVGIAAALHVAAAAPGRLLACGLATAPLLAGDLTGDAPRARAGEMALARQPGLGVAIDPRALERWRIDGE